MLWWIFNVKHIHSFTSLLNLSATFKKRCLKEKILPPPKCLLSFLNKNRYFFLSNSQGYWLLKLFLPPQKEYLIFFLFELQNWNKHVIQRLHISIFPHPVSHQGVHEEMPNFRYWFVVAQQANSCFIFLPSDTKEQLWMDLKAGAESGWDFSSRWYIDGDGHNNGTLRETRTSQILPTDLNALLCLNEKTLAAFHRILGEYMSSHWPWSSLWSARF